MQSDAMTSNGHHSVFPFNFDSHAVMNAHSNRVPSIDATSHRFPSIDTNSNRAKSMPEANSNRVSLDAKSASGYKPFIPKSSYHVTLSHSFESIHCKGCGKSFKRASTHHEPGYYVHCINECEKYRSLGLIKECHSCKLSFINTNSGRYHPCFNQRYKAPIKPDWMTRSTFLTALMSTNASNKIDTKCPGCARTFKVATYGKNGGIRHSYEYIVHVVSECDAYKRLGHIKQCEKCSCLFMNQKALKGHWYKCKK